MYAAERTGGVVMTDHDEATIQIVTERFERRLAETSGKLRIEMADGFGRLRTDMAERSGCLRSDMADGFGTLRADMIERKAELLKWLLIFGVTQTAALAGLLALFR